MLPNGGETTPNDFKRCFPSFLTLLRGFPPYYVVFPLILPLEG